MVTGLIRSTIDVSLVIQWIALIIGFVASGVGAPGPIGVVLMMENIVQIIEILFYHWYRWMTFGSSAIASGASDIAWVRYVDWVFTTPVMLASTALYFSWINNQQTSEPSKDKTKEQQDSENSPDSFDILNWLTSHRSSLLIMFLANLAMLAFGFLQEVGLLDIVWSSLLGFIALFISFGELGNSFVWDKPFDIFSGSTRNQIIYWPMFVTWLMYGIAAMMPSVPKNVSYNILDLIAKNFYGLYLSGIILFS